MVREDDHSDGGSTAKSTSYASKGFHLNEGKARGESSTSAGYVRSVEC